MAHTNFMYLEALKRILYRSAIFSSLCIHLFNPYCAGYDITHCFAIGSSHFANALVQCTPMEEAYTLAVPSSLPLYSPFAQSRRYHATFHAEITSVSEIMYPTSPFRLQQCIQTACVFEATPSNIPFV